MGLGDMFRSFIGLPPRDDWSRRPMPPDMYSDGREGHPRNMEEWLRDAPPIIFGSIPSGRLRPRDPDDDDDEDDGHHYHGHAGPEPFQFGFTFRFPFDHGIGVEPDNEGPDGPDPFGHDIRMSSPEDMFRHFEQVFRGFDDVFRGMGIGDHFPGHQGPGGVPALPGTGEESQDSPRDKMLKEPDSHSAPINGLPNGTNPGQQSPNMFGKTWTAQQWDDQTWDKMDRDLDEHAKKGGLKDIFGKLDSKVDRSNSPYHGNHGNHGNASPAPGGGFKSVSVRTYRSADGKVEERRTVKDGLGHEETVVMRHIDGQTHTLTTQREGPGDNQVVDENFRNMDRRDLNDFDRRWHSPTPNFDRDRPEDDIILPDGKTQSMFKNLFGLSFPGFKS